MKTKMKKYHFVMQIPEDGFFPTLGESVITAKNRLEAFNIGLKFISKNRVLKTPSVAFVYPKRGVIDLVSNDGNHISFNVLNEYEFHHYFENVEIPIFETNEELDAIFDLDKHYKESRREIRTIEDGFEIEH